MRLKDSYLKLLLDVDSINVVIDFVYWVCILIDIVV